MCGERGEGKASALSQLFNADHSGFWSLGHLVRFVLYC